MMEGNDRGKEGSRHSEIHSSLFVSTPTILVCLSWEISLLEAEGEMGFLVFFTMKTYLALNLSKMGFSILSDICAAFRDGSI